VLPYDEKSDQLDRLVRLAFSRPLRRAELRQVLEAHRVSDLTHFADELLGRIDGSRQQLSKLEEEFLRTKDGKIPDDEKREMISSLLAQINSRREEARAKRLTPLEAAVVLHFYQGLDVQSNRLLQAKPIYYQNTLTARRFAQIIQLPPIELRTHGRDLPLVKFDPEVDSPRWHSVLEPFWKLGLRGEWMQIWSQLVNQTAGAERYRHLEGFEFRFLHELRRFALAGAGQPHLFLAKEILEAYLANYNSTVKGLDVYGEEAAVWPESAKKSLAYTLLLLSQMRNRAEIERLFSIGYLPKRFPENGSRQLRKALVTFRTASKNPDREGCVAQLTAIFKRR